MRSTGARPGIAAAIGAEGFSMFENRLALLLAVVLPLGCTGSAINVSQGDSNHSAAATAVIAPEKDGGARDLDVEVTMPEPPPVMPGMSTVDVRYVFEIKNTGQSPATVKRINMASAAGSYQLESWSRTYKKTIAPGATEKLSFLARAIEVDPNIGTRAPMAVRAQIEYENAEGVQKASFVRNVGGTVAFGVTSDQ
jgi:hypothetical protein